MTTKDKKPVPFIKADLIKRVNRYNVGNTSYLELRHACNYISHHYVERKFNQDLYFKSDYKSIEAVNHNYKRKEKLAKRLEREFLRKEKQLEIGKNEALLKVSVIDLKEEIESIEEIRMHVDNPKLLNIRDQLDEWIFNTQPFNNVGLCTIKAKIEEVDCELYSSFMWDFELIDFKPLDK